MAGLQLGEKGNTIYLWQFSVSYWKLAVKTRLNMNKHEYMAGSVTVTGNLQYQAWEVTGLDLDEEAEDNEMEQEMQAAEAGDEEAEEEAEEVGH